MHRPEILQRREEYSVERLDLFASGISASRSDPALEHLAVFCAGSYARLEAGAWSDLDLFFIYGPEAGSNGPDRAAEIKFFAEVINTAEKMRFEKFSNNAQYLATLSCEEMLTHLGSPLDDHLNLFTMRMLMLLESRCVGGHEAFSDLQRAAIRAYYRDYPNHQGSFEPWFLMNDIGRYWKTLLLNYENRRNQPVDDDATRIKQKVKNFKLKYSRMTTCFATIAALASLPAPVTEDQVFDLIQHTPQDRLTSIPTNLTGTAGIVQQIVEEYAWFLDESGEHAARLHVRFCDKDQRVEYFRRANAYGDLVFGLLGQIAKLQAPNNPGRLMRYLVI